MRSARALSIVTMVLVGTAVLRAAGDIRVTPLVADRQVSASFNAAPTFDQDARQVMQSGLLLTFSYTVELRRPSTIWLDPTLAAVTVASSVKFDNLTGEYLVSKLLDGRVISSEHTKDEAQVRIWMTAFDRVALVPGSPLEPNADYYVRVRLRASPKRTFSLWPWGGDDGLGRADFTFLG